jgi:hypothetical protein
MTEQEKQLIAGLANRIENAPPPHIDGAADDLIRHTIGAQPDALYILTQTVLLQEMALNQAKAQIEELKQRPGTQQQYAPQSGGFLPSQGGQPDYAAPQAAPAPSGGRFSGFLHQAATTAAGVIAGDLAFEALGSLFGHRGGFSGGGGGGFFGGNPIVPGSETIVNNYYGDQGGAGGDDSQFASAADRSGDDMSPDIEDDRDSGGDAFDSGGDDGSDSSDGSFDGSSDV